MLQLFLAVQPREGLRHVDLGLRCKIRRQGRAVHAGVVGSAPRRVRRRHGRAGAGVFRGFDRGLPGC